MWHGDARQFNFMDLFDRLRAKEAEVGTERLTARERARLAYIRESTATQDAFYARLGINGRISRVGHELATPVRQWLLSVQEMQAFGVTDVQAPAGYGTPAFCDARREREPLLQMASCLTLTAEDVAGSVAHARPADFLPVLGVD